MNCQCVGMSVSVMTDSKCVKTHMSPERKTVRVRNCVQSSIIVVGVFVQMILIMQKCSIFP